MQQGEGVRVVRPPFLAHRADLPDDERVRRATGDEDPRRRLRAGDVLRGRHRPSSAQDGLLARDARRRVDRDAARVRPVRFHRDAVLPLLHHEGAKVRRALDDRNSRVDEDPAVRRQEPLIPLVRVVAKEVNLGGHVARLEERRAERIRRVHVRDGGEVVRHGGDAVAAEGEVVDVVLDRHGVLVRPESLCRAAVVGRRAAIAASVGGLRVCRDEAAEKEARIGLGLVRHRDGRPVLTESHRERLAGHREIPRVPRISQLAGVVDGVAAQRTAGDGALAADELERGIRVGCRVRWRPVDVTRIVVVLDVHPGQRGIAANGDDETALVLRELSVRCERSDDDRVAEVDRGVHRRRARLPDREPLRTSVVATRRIVWVRGRGVEGGVRATKSGRGGDSSFER